MTAKRYADDVSASASEFQVDPSLIFAICETESHFNPQAKSSAGAIGIMQIMPETGKWIAENLSFSDYREEVLSDPSINIRFGAYYLAYLSSLFSEFWQVIAAYNAGEGAVSLWIEKGISEESIPFPETKRYVAKVKRAFARYQEKISLLFD